MKLSLSGVGIRWSGSHALHACQAPQLQCRFGKSHYQLDGCSVGPKRTRYSQWRSHHQSEGSQQGDISMLRSRISIHPTTLMTVEFGSAATMAPNRTAGTHHRCRLPPALLHSIGSRMPSSSPWQRSGVSTARGRIRSSTSHNADRGLTTLYFTLVR